MRNFPRIYIYRPDRAWHKNVMRDCLYTVKGRQIDTQPPEPKPKSTKRIAALKELPPKSYDNVSISRFQF